jgi:uroporphyrinogen-III decarboxylase
LKIDTAAREQIRRLMDRVRRIAEEPKNLERARLWEPAPETARDHWRGTPRPRKDLPRAPITVEPEITMWARILGFSMLDFYRDPVCYLTNSLRMMVYRYEHWDDDTAVGLQVPIWLGVTLESSLFGARTIFEQDEYPWLDREPVIRSEEDLERLEYPDFRSSGLMPQAHRYYEVLRELLDEDFTVTFPEWGRSPYGVAFHIRGYENLAVDMAGDGEFVHRLLAFITESRKRWTTERARFLGRKVEKGNLYNDEVNTPSMSPLMYEQFALPYERELSDFHGGILYWHSCGDTTAMVDRIARIGTLELFHVGPWTDGAVCLQVFQGKVPLEFCLHPFQDVQHADPQTREKRLRSIAAICGGTPYTVRADGIQVIDGPGAAGLEKGIRAIVEWIATADRVLRESPPGGVL